ncbi:TspO/MBR family protein [Halobaculum sp. MBLA0147]|uniref:TspO/MBR family protein n=1 Tax=Halobaculum sp. MBLA0147 TaxID=3079934 RepID=UPI0035246E3E
MSSRRVLDRADWDDRLDGPLGAVALVLVVNAVGAAPALLAGPDTAWFAALEKPGIYPPSATFAVVWTTLFTLQGVAVWLVVRGAVGRERRLALGVFAAQFLVNVAWTPAFFGLQSIPLALVVAGLLVPLVAAAAYRFWLIDRRAGALLVPYLAWAGFAVLLTYRFLVVN